MSSEIFALILYTAALAGAIVCSLGICSVIKQHKKRKDIYYFEDTAETVTDERTSEEDESAYDDFDYDSVADDRYMENTDEESLIQNIHLTNQPLTISEVYSFFEESESKTVSEQRSREDHSYNILRRKIDELNSNNENA